jgi:hypothetical protein
MERIALTAAYVLLCVLSCFSSVNAEVREIEKIGQWTFYQDGDEIFGKLGYQITLPSSNNGQSSKLNVFCTFEGSDEYSFGVNIFSDSIDFRQVLNDGVAKSLLKLDQEEVREVNWLPNKNPKSLTFTTLHNTSLDNDDEAYSLAVEAVRIGENTANLFLRGFNYNNAIGRLLWNLTFRDQLALGFVVGGTRQNLVFKLAESKRAMERLFLACAKGANPEGSQEKISPRERATWSLLKTENGEYKSVSLKANECLELHVVKRRRSDPIMVAEQTGDNEFIRETFESGDTVIAGPRKLLQIFFGENASAGVFNARVWDHGGEGCPKN